ncbi:exopolysaccharide biosynthesis protein [Frigidibacter sp.]|uniref:exopolysaccharide biosynthesis protein n=1 Tax=Frigidibacter sp. TaxID=2586418 RepID=UPI0027336D1D|nr:exopolysaccharide biosynthesis protein [Frigidibacter sp.]MDP3340954.1 exopolysaccharide biosynthesis protein [Frigidibacter sp.]
MPVPAPGSPGEPRGRGHRAPPPKKKLSLILAELAEDGARERISVADLVQILQARAFGALLLVFALPNVLPAPPGTSGILGLPLLYLAAQMMLGKPAWLPAFISKRSMLREDFGALITRVTPMLMRAERLLVPRLPALSTPLAQQLVGGLCLVLAIVLVLPIPLGNMLPAFAICLIALGILERDGAWILGGSATGLLALLIVYGVIYAMIRAAMFVIFNAF